MYTVTITRTVSAGSAAQPGVTGVQYASLSDYTAAMRGELAMGMTAVSHRRCRTRPGAWWQARLARRAGNSASVTRGDRLAGSLQMWRAIAGLPGSDADERTVRGIGAAWGMHPPGT